MRGNVSRELDAVALINLEPLIPAKHPIRRVKQLVDSVLVDLEEEVEQMYAELGSPPITSAASTGFSGPPKSSR